MSDEDYEYTMQMRWDEAIFNANMALVKKLDVINYDTMKLLHEAIEEAHAADDPEWTFNINWLIEAIARAVGRPLTDDEVEYIDENFPVSP